MSVLPEQQLKTQNLFHLLPRTVWPQQAADRHIWDAGTRRCMTCVLEEITEPIHQLLKLASQWRRLSFHTSLERESTSVSRPKVLRSTDAHICTLHMFTCKKCLDAVLDRVSLYLQFFHISANSWTASASGLSCHMSYSLLPQKTHFNPKPSNTLPFSSH